MTAYAEPVDAGAHGEHRPVVLGGAWRPRFAGRVPSPAPAGRYHLYASWICPRSHRATIVRALLGLETAVSVGHVDHLRDARGWAFRERTGPDVVNGFTLLREAYEATDPHDHGPVTVPVLWDKHERRIVSNDPDTIDADLATAFPTDGPELYPARLRVAVDEVTAEVTSLSRLVTRAVYSAVDRPVLAARWSDLDRRLSRRPYLLGDTLTLADVRLWTLLVRYDAGPNATGAAGPALSTFPSLWRWARGLYALDAFRRTTDFAAFTTRLVALPAWDADPAAPPPAPRGRRTAP